MNGYFQLSVNKEGVSVILFPPIGEGEKIRVNELKEYLDRVGVPYDNKAINSALHDLGEEEVAVFLSSMQIPPVDEKCTIDVTHDRLTAVMRLFPPSVGGAPLTRAHVMEILQREKITTGIDDAAIRAALEEKEYCTDIIVARGSTPTAGRDASVVFHFDTNNSTRPELNEDGSVDFFKLNRLHHCTKGQVLAEIIPEQKGDDGVDVFGNVTPAREVKSTKIPHGRNIEVSEDGLKYISMVDGHAALVDGTVFVSDVYAVENVGTSTGNIQYHGDVDVKGNVCENFCVKTDGNVFVNGVVEGANIEAGGNIIIVRGMHGQNKGILKAGGNIIAKFISAAQVEAGGFVEAEQILNARVTAGTYVNAEAGKGLITGGRVVAKKAVNVKNAGSAMGATTTIEVGCDPEAKKRLAMLQKDVGEKSKMIPQMKKVIEETARKLKSGVTLTPDQIKKARALQVTLAETQKQVQESLKEIEALDSLIKGEDNAHIDVRGTMYQGVNISISGATMTIKNEYTYCRLIKKGADVASTNL